MESIPVVVQYRHLHLSETDWKALFGDAEMAHAQDLGHRGQMVCQQTVSIVAEKGRLDDVRVLGPVRSETQLELSPTDAYALGVNAPLRVSGDLIRSGSCTIIGPEGEVEANSVAILPARHLHCRPQDAERLGVAHHDTISVSIPERDLTIDHVVVRVHPTFGLEFHLSTDEAAEYWLQSGDHVIVN